MPGKGSHIKVSDIGFRDPQLAFATPISRFKVGQLRVKLPYRSKFKVQANVVLVLPQGSKYLIIIYSPKS